MDDIGGWLEPFLVYCLVLTLLEGSLTLLAVDLADLWPVHRPRVVSVRSGLQQFVYASIVVQLALYRNSYDIIINGCLLKPITTRNLL